MTASATTPARHRRRRILIALLVLVLLVFLLPLISLGHYHHTIAASLSRSLGHTVNIGSINLTLLPFPGLEIHNLTVEEDPSFGAEPLLIAPTVTIYPRLSTLWTLRFEIGRIDFDDASVNLVRDPAGRWNFSSLMLQASRSQAAPTAQRRPSRTPRFPYVEFSSARINFKQGYVKKPFSLLNTDASVWLSDSDHWRIRLKAQPVRTDLDLDLGDTGTVRVDGTITRAASLEQLPLDLHASWTGAQLGQVSRLVFGFDSEWRGDLRMEADITGDLENLKIHPRVHIINAHRLEFTPLSELDIDAFCEAMYHRPAHSLDHLICLLPTGSGHLLLTGSVPNLGHPQPNLKFEINHTPASFVVDLLGILRRTLPTDLSASGVINGAFTWAPPAASARAHRVSKRQGTENAPDVLTGHAVAENVSINLANVNQPFTFPSLTFATPNWTPPSTHKTETKRRVPHVSKRRGMDPVHGKDTSSGNIILLLPSSFSAGAATPMHASAQLSRSGFSLHFTGESSLARFQPVTADFSQLQPLQALAAKGTADTDLTLSGPWLLPVSLEPGPGTQSQLRGFVRLEHAQLAPGWLPEPINIASATVQFGKPPAQPNASDTITWAEAAISVNGITAKGSAAYPAACAGPSPCAAQVNLDFPSLDAAALQTALYGANPGAFLQSLLSTVESAPPGWPLIVGTVHASTFTIGTLRFTNARAAIAVQGGKLHLSSFDATTLGGSTHATGSIQNTSNGPAYALNLTWAGIKLPQVAALFHEKWGTGSIDGQSALKLQGFSSLASSATGTFSWTINGPWSGNLAEAPLPGQSALGKPGSAVSQPTGAATNPVSAQAQSRGPREQVFARGVESASSPAAGTRQLLLHLPLVRLYPQLAHWSASGTIANQTLTFTRGPATGTISFARKLNLTWQPVSSASLSARSRSVAITGTLAHPLITARLAKASLPVAAP